MAIRRKLRKNEPPERSKTAPPAVTQRSRTRTSLVEGALRSPGEPLDRETRARFEPVFGHRFDEVRVHADDDAAVSAAALGAAAYTVGDDLVFAAGRYRPSSGEGQALLAHELAHVVQQDDSTGSARSVPSLDVSRPGDHLERDARHAAQRALAGQSAPVGERGAAAGVIAREEADQTPAIPAQTGATGGVTVQEVSAAHGVEQHSSRLNTTYEVPWTVWIENDVLLFEFSNTRGGPCTLNIVLEDSEGNGVIATGSLSFADGDNSTRYLEFSGFPARAGGGVRDQCVATITLTNDANPNEGYEIYHRIFRG
jgi:hypothetical protein